MFRRRAIQIFLCGFAMLAGCYARATLVIVIPSADGAVIAADSRITLRKKYLDGIEKIHFLPECQNIAFTLTGQSEFYPVFSDNATEQELRGEIQDGRRDYSAQAEVAKFLKRQPKGAILDSTMLAGLGKRLSETLIDALRSRINGQPFRGKTLFRAVVVQFDMLDSTTRVGSLRIDLSAFGIPTVQDIRMDVIPKENPRIALIFGEQKYFDEHVRKGVGAQFIPAGISAHWNQGGRITDFDADSAQAIARGWIGATAKTCEIVPCPSGVGGPLKVYLLTGGRQARELKSNEPRTFSK